MRLPSDLQVRILALTDHDSLAGVAAATSAAAPYRICVLPGVEISAFWEGSGHRWQSVHVLGYFKPAGLRSSEEAALMAAALASESEAGSNEQGWRGGGRKDNAQSDGGSMVNRDRLEEVWGREGAERRDPTATTGADAMEGSLKQGPSRDDEGGAAVVDREGEERRGREGRDEGEEGKEGEGEGQERQEEGERGVMEGNEGMSASTAAKVASGSDVETTGQCLSPEWSNLSGALRRIREGRFSRASQIVSRLQELGVELTMEDVTRVSEDASYVRECNCFMECDVRTHSRKCCWLAFLGTLTLLLVSCSLHWPRSNGNLASERQFHMLTARYLSIHGTF